MNHTPSNLDPFSHAENILARFQSDDTHSDLKVQMASAAVLLVQSLERSGNTPSHVINAIREQLAVPLAFIRQHNERHGGQFISLD